MWRSYVELLKPKFIIPSLISGLVASIIANYHHDGACISFSLLTVLLIIALVTAAGLVINQCYDYELDVSSSRNDLPLVRGEVERKTAAFIGYGLFVLALLLAFMISKGALFLTAVASLLAIAYSAPPLRFKARPFFDSFVNGITYGPLSMSLVFASLGFPIKEALVYSLPFLIGLSAGHMLLAVPTIEEDKRFGVVTSAAYLGRERAIKLGMGLYALMSCMVVIYCLFGLFPLESLTFLPLMAYIEFQFWRWLGGAEKKEVFRKMEVAFLLMALVFLLPFVHGV